MSMIAAGRTVRRALLSRVAVNPARRGAGSGAVADLPAIRTAFDAAVEKTGGLSERRVLIGGAAVRLRFASESLATLLTSSFAHLPAAAAAEGSALTVSIWDEAATGVALPGAEGFATHARPPAEAAPQARWFPHSGVASVFDPAGAQAFYWLRDPAALPAYEVSSPLLLILHWWLAARGWQLAHAGAVGLPDGGVLLAGAGGAGKSTSVLACLPSALRVAAEDYCALSDEAPPRIHSLYCAAKVNAGSLARLPHLAALARGGRAAEEGKTLMFLHPRFAENIALDFPLRAILLPRLGGGAETRLRPASAAAALLALAPSTIFQLNAAAGPALARLGRMVRAVPAYFLDLGPGVTQIPRVLLDLLHRL